MSTLTLAANGIIHVIHAIESAGLVDNDLRRSLASLRAEYPLLRRDVQELQLFAFRFFAFAFYCHVPFLDQNRISQTKLFPYFQANQGDWEQRQVIDRI